MIRIRLPSRRRGLLAAACLLILALLMGVAPSLARPGPPDGQAQPGRSSDAVGRHDDESGTGTTPSLWTVLPWVPVEPEPTTTEPSPVPTGPIDALAIGDSNFPDPLVHLPPSHVLWRVRMYDGHGLSTPCGDRPCIVEQLERDVADDAPSLVVVTVGGVDAKRGMAPAAFATAIDELMAAAGPFAMVVAIGSMPLRGFEATVAGLNAEWVAASGRHPKLWFVDPLVDIVDGALDGSCLTRDARGAFGLSTLEACYLDWALEGVHLSRHGTQMVALFTTLLLDHWLSGADRDTAVAAAQRTLRCLSGLPGCG